MSASCVAFFDLDKTLISVNSMSLWMRREVRLGHLSRWAAMRGACWMGMYHLGVGKMEDAIQGAVASVGGEEEDPFRQRVVDFWREDVQHTLRAAARQAVDWHRAQGHEVALLTSSSPYMSEVVGRELAIDAHLCNRFEVKDGRFTGRAHLPLCYGDGKRTHAQAFAEGLGIDLDRCWFYTDSITDLPALEAVGHPVAVNPDPRLGRVARQRKWRVVDWDGDGSFQPEEAPDV